MIEIDCPHEQEVAEAVAVGLWPVGCDTALVTHAASCPICADVVTVAGAIHDAASRVCAEARVPGAGLVWWRAHLRARQQVAESAGRPIGYLHALAAAVAAGLFLTLGGLLWPWLLASVDWSDAISSPAAMSRLWVPFALAAGAWLVLAPVLLWLVFSEEYK